MNKWKIKSENSKKRTKNFEVKANENGTISGYFSTYDRDPDSYGDIVAPGAFTDTLKKRKEIGHPFPLCWNHDLNQIIGKVDAENIEDTKKGPLITASFFDNPLAQEKRDWVKSGVVYQFSFAYDVLDEGTVELEDGKKANELRKLELYEVSIVPMPANQHAQVTDIKSGKRNSKSDEDKLTQAINLIQEVLGQLDDTEENHNAEDLSKANDVNTSKELKDINAKKDFLLETIKKLKN